MKNKAIKNSKGSALVTAIAVMTILIVIAMGSIATSTNNMQISKTVTENERSYYAAENATQVAISTIKDEITKYYMQMGQSGSYSD
jgi:Tfp pilus assembly protein PilX